MPVERGRNATGQLTAIQARQKPQVTERAAALAKHYTQPGNGTPERIPAAPGNGPRPDTSALAQLNQYEGTPSMDFHRTFVAPHDVKPLKAAEAGLAIAPSHVLVRLGQELIGIGPGTYDLGKGEAADARAAAAGDYSFKNTKAAGKALADSYKESVTHPIRQFENDPLGLITNALGVFGAAGRAASVGDALKAGDIAGAAKNAVRHAPSPKREIRVGGGDTVHPVASRNLGVAYLQKAGDKVTQHALDNPDSFTAKTLNVGRLKRNGEAVGVLGPEVKVGREMRAEARFQDPAEKAAARDAARYGTATPGKLRRDADSKVTKILSRAVGGKKLTAAEQRAVQIAASGVNHTAHLDAHANAATDLEQHIADLHHEIEARNGEGVAKLTQQLKAAEKSLAGHRQQVALVHGASNVADRPIVQQAVEAGRKAIDARERLRGMTEDQILHRLGAHATTIKHLADNGLKGESPIQKATRIEAELKDVKPPEDGELERVQTRLAENEHEQQTRATDTHLAQLRLEQSALNTRAQQIHDFERVAALHNHLIQEGAKVREAGGYYLPVETGLKRNAALPLGGARVTTGDYGAGPPVLQPVHHYEGKTVTGGVFRSDATNLATKAVRQQIKDHAAVTQFQRLWDQAKPVDETEVPAKFRVYVRDVRQAPTDLKSAANAIDQGAFDPKDFEDESHLKQLLEWQTNQVVQPGEHVKVIDGRRLGPLRPYVPKLGTAGEAADAFNQLIRIGRYGPSYVKWLPQNLVLTVAEQGPMVIRSLHKLMGEARKLTPDVYDQIAEDAGTSHGTASALQGDTKFLHGASSKLAGFWARFVDHGPRMLMWFHVAAQHGFKNAADWERLYSDPALNTERTLIAREANQRSIDYGAITNAERATLKKLFISWPWTSAASRWAGRFFVNHPVQGKVYALAGQQGDQSNQNFYEGLGGVEPTFVESQIPMAGNRTFDTSFLNPAETPGSWSELLGGLTGGGVYGGQGYRQVSPLVGALMEALSGANKSGTPDKTGHQWLLDLVKKVGPVGDALLAGEKAPGASQQPRATPGGVTAALERFLGSPVSPVNLQAAASSGLKTFKERTSKTEQQPVLNELTATLLARMIHDGQMDVQTAKGYLPAQYWPILTGGK